MAAEYASEGSDKQVVNNASLPKKLSDKKECEVSSIDTTIEERLNKVFDSVGYGLFHVILTIVCGLALASDWIEILCVSFIIPVAEGELHLSDVDKATLNSMIFVGIIIGSLFWGSLSDAVGRRKCLFISLLLNGISGLCSSLMPNFVFFLFFRLLSGIGVGGSLPVTISYYSEFLSAKKTGPLLIVLKIFWLIADILIALLAWGLLSNPCLVDVHISSMPFRSWRVFTMLCTLPAITVAPTFILLPESPSWLYIMGRHEKAEKVLKCIAHVNRIFGLRGKKQEPDSKVGYLEFETVNSHSHDDCIQGPGTPPSCYGKQNFNIKNICSDVGSKITMMLKALYHLFTRAYILITVVMIIMQFSLAFSSYGYRIWLPEYFKHLLRNTANDTHEGCHVGTDNCSQLNTSCSSVYLDTLAVSGTSIPGLLVGIVTINLVGARVQYATSMIVSGVSIFLIWWLPPAEVTVVVLSSLFNSLITISWNALIVSYVEYYATGVRSSALGLLSLVSRVAAIVANFTFGALQTTNPGLPIFLVSMALIVGGIMPVFLPLSSDPDQHSLLGKQFRKWMSLMWSKIKTKFYM